MSRLRARWAVLVVGILAAGAVGAVACTRTDPPPTGIALVDTDTGPTGARIAQSLTKDGGGYDWTVVEPGAASTADYAAVITLPADLTTAMGSLAGPQPQRAKLTRGHPRGRRPAPGRRRHRGAHQTDRRHRR
ncbi:hypothetical protein [Nocardia farcinica]|uniref:hypothetical protein n=1 Tax=Nocardia farcinica TaxID=37329 RepID=UPI002017ED57|nr:hypothetical protein [Nocardia farcinica]